MKLSFKERLIFVALYPEKGSLTDQILVRDINEKIQITQEEMTEANYKISPSKNGSVATWDNEKAEEIEVSFSGAELNFLKGRIDKLDKDESITQEILSLCQKIKEEK